MNKSKETYYYSFNKWEKEHFPKLVEERRLKREREKFLQEKLSEQVKRNKRQGREYRQ